MRTKFIWMVLLLLLLSIVPIGHAQDPITQPLEFDPEFNDYSAFFDITVNSGDSITLDVQTAGTITAGILDPVGNIVLDGIPQNYTFEASGDYIVIASSTDDGTATLSFGAAPTRTEPDPPAQVEVPDPILQEVGSIDDVNYLAEYSVTMAAGQYIVANVEATSGDLDTYLLFGNDQALIAENDDLDPSTLNSRVVAQVQADGTYTVVVTRYNFQDGVSSGDYALTVWVLNPDQAVALGVIDGDVATAPPPSEGGPSPGGQAPPPDPTANGYPSINPAPRATYTILAYYGADNNLEGGLLFDLNEFELAGGSDDNVRVVMLIDRSGEYDESNGNWSEVRVFEIAPDASDGSIDGMFQNYPGIIDSVESFSLGELDTSQERTLTDFLVWGVQAYPADNFVVAINDHGGGWTGFVTDDTDSGGAQAIPIKGLANAFNAATQAAGVERFTLLVNDACLMSNVEYYNEVGPFFEYSIAAPELTYNPGFPMHLMTQGLKQNTPLPELGTILVNEYYAFFETFAPDIVGVQTPTITNMLAFPNVVAAIEAFAEVVNTNPNRYASILGQARANTYNYSMDEYVLRDHIDVGDFLSEIMALSDDPALTQAAQNAIATMQNALLYSQRGGNVPASATLYSIYFPTSADEYQRSEYQRNTGLAQWQLMLDNYFGAVVPVARTVAVQPRSASPAASVRPQVSITNQYPAEASIIDPAILSMEVVGRNIAKGIFTVDQFQADGTLLRVDTSDIITLVEQEDGSFEAVNLWQSGVDDSNFFWDVRLPVLTDGNTSNVELIKSIGDQTTLEGLYRDTPNQNWVETTLFFDDNGVAIRAQGGAVGSTTLGEVRLQPGGEFQAYRAVVTGDGRVRQEPGTAYVIPPDGLRFAMEPAPSGQYNLGFQVEAFGGLTGFQSVMVAVNNEGLDPNVYGNTFIEDGFTVVLPNSWSSLEFSPSLGYYTANSADADQYAVVYADYQATSAQEASQSYLATYGYEQTGDFSDISVDGQPAQAFTYTADFGGETYTAQAFAVYREDEALSLVFAIEAQDGVDSSVYEDLLLTQTRLLPITDILAQDTGEWTTDFTQDEAAAFPIRETWAPGYETESGGFVYYQDNDQNAPTDASFFTVESSGDAAADLQNVLQGFAASQPGYALDRTETYYGQNLTWEVAYYTYDGITGRMYLHQGDGTAYVWGFETPTDEADTVFRNTFEPMVDGFYFLDQ